jgi:hypothetical protein
VNSCLKCEIGICFEFNLCKVCFLEFKGKPPLFKLLKQTEISKYIKSVLNGYGVKDILFNKFVAGYYPDIRFQVNSKHVIIEIDENQHKGGVAYSQDREKKRINSLRKEFPVLILLRINPDKFNGREAMFTFKEDILQGKKEIVYNVGEIEYRNEQINLYLRWIILLLINNDFKSFMEIRLFFD